jgi:hypothetical protein
MTAMKKINDTTYTTKEKLGDVKPNIVIGGDDPSVFSQELRMGFDFKTGNEEYFIKLKRRPTRYNGWTLTPDQIGLVGKRIDKNSLPVYDGPVVNGVYHEPPRDTIIYRNKILYPVSMKNGNIKIIECWAPLSLTIAKSSLFCGYDFNTNNPAPYPSSIIDTEIDGSTCDINTMAYTVAVRGMVNLSRVYIHHVGDGFGIFDYGESCDITVEDVYVSDILGVGTGSSGSHNESATIRGFKGRGLIIQRCHLESKSGHDSAAMFIQPWQTSIANVVIKDSYLETLKQWVVYLEMNSGGYSNMGLINNRMKVESGNTYIGVADGPGFSTRHDNYIYDPNQPDCRGASLD